MAKTYQSRYICPDNMTYCMPLYLFNMGSYINTWKMDVNMEYLYGKLDFRSNNYRIWANLFDILAF